MKTVQERTIDIFPEDPWQKPPRREFVTSEEFDWKWECPVWNMYRRGKECRLASIEREAITSGWHYVVQTLTSDRKKVFSTLLEAGQYAEALCRK